MKRVLFLHGYGSDPNGIRPAFLKESGYEVSHPALGDDDFDASVHIARQAFEQHRPDVVVGSSRGGAVALQLDISETPLVLIAPAWSKWGRAAKLSANTIILHSEHDDVVPIAGSRELLRRNALSDERLIVVGDSHRMTDDAAFQALLDAIERVGETP